MRRIQTCIEEKQYKWLMEESDRTEKSMAWIIRKAIKALMLSTEDVKDYLERRTGRPPASMKND